LPQCQKEGRWQKAVASATGEANLLCQKYVVAGHRGKKEIENVCGKEREME